MPMPDLLEEQEEQEVQEICNTKKFNGALHYLVKWTGWPSEYDSWEPAKHLIGASKRVQEFKRTKKQKREKATQILTRMVGIFMRMLGNFGNFNTREAINGAT